MSNTSIENTNFAVHMLLKASNKTVQDIDFH